MIRVYSTDHQHSMVLSKAFANGCQGQIVPPVRLMDGDAAFYGILRGCGDLIKQCQWVGKDFYHIDHGYFNRGHYDGYYRVSKNAFQWKPKFVSRYHHDRWEKLDVELKPWQTGRHVVVIPLTGAVGKFLGVDSDKWTEAVVGEISKHTDRPIIIKKKDGTPLGGVLEDCHCLVTHSSNAAVDALVEGIPVCTLGDSAASYLSTPIAQIETPRYPPREEWCFAVAYHQFTIEEMHNGTAWRLIKEYS